MKRAFAVAASIPALILFVLAGLWWVGLEPQDQRPGLWLAGELVTTPVTDWSFTDRFGEIFIETRTWYWVPHSITGFCAVHQNQLYLISAYYEGGQFPDGKHWNRNVVRDPRVRLKIGDRLYRARVELVSEAALREELHQTFLRKYKDWESPGLNKLYFLRVDPIG